jgi:hypothetical protein
MAFIVNHAIRTLSQILRAQDGVAATCANLQQAGAFEAPLLADSDVLELQAPAELLEKAGGGRYPSIYIFCERLANTHREKFRTFSGTAELVAEVRVTHDHAESVNGHLQNYVEALTDVLDRSRGVWGQGLHFSGAYEVLFGPIKRGGKNYVQTAKVRLDVHVSAD